MPSDPVASLIWDEAQPAAGRVLVVDDVDGQLCALALAAGCEVLAWTDDLREAAALPPEVERVDLLTDAALPQVTVALWRLPRAVDRVANVAEILGAHRVSQIVAGGRVKHMSRAMNVALEQSYQEVSASLGRQHSRVLRAGAPLREVPATFPREAATDLGITLVSYGGVFAAGRVDQGTRLLLQCLRDVEPRSALDLGCGGGLLAVKLATQQWQMIASDVSAAAVASCVATAAANQVSVEVVAADLVPPGLNDLDAVVCNPPFHRGATKDSGDAVEMIGAAGAALRPGGQLWLVFNSHLPYLPIARAQVGPTRIMARDRSYLVTCSTRR